MMNKKIEKHLKLTCPACSTLYQLWEIHQGEKNNCTSNCLKEWQELLNKHYQEQIILHLAQEEAAKEEND